MAIMVGYRRGPGRAYQNVALLRVPDWDGSTDLTGWRAIAVDRHGNRYEGVIVGRHGRGNVFRARFRPNLPGQMIGRSVELLRSSLSPQTARNRSDLKRQGLRPRPRITGDHRGVMGRRRGQRHGPPIHGHPALARSSAPIAEAIIRAAPQPTRVL